MCMHAHEQTGLLSLLLSLSFGFIVLISFQTLLCPATSPATSRQLTQNAENSVPVECMHNRAVLMLIHERIACITSSNSCSAAHWSSCCDPQIHTAYAKAQHSAPGAQPVVQLLPPVVRKRASLKLGRNKPHSAVMPPCCNTAPGQRVGEDRRRAVYKCD